jgi:hypothetical protein
MATVWVVVRQQNGCELIILEGIYSTEAKAQVKADPSDLIREWGKWKLTGPNYWETRSDQIYIEERAVDRYDEEREY